MDKACSVAWPLPAGETRAMDFVVLIDFIVFIKTEVLIQALSE
jgi:hypothetical protein